MRRFTAVLLALGALLTAPGAAFADTGKVTVFTTEAQPLSNYEEPSGCFSLPPTAHVLINQTQQPVRIYADPFCTTPNLAIEPGRGSHVMPGSGSFSA